MEFPETVSEHKFLAVAAVFVLLISGVVFAIFGQITAVGELSQDARSQGGFQDSSAVRSAERSLPGPDQDATDAENRRRAVSVDMRFEVPDVRSAIDSSSALAEDFGGFTENENLERESRERGSVTVRVPDENASDFISELEESDGWVLESRNRRVQDLTSTYTQTELELRNKRQELRRLEELVNQTDDVSTLIDIQQRMSDVRSRVQFLENQLETLETRTSFTEVTLRFEEPSSFSTRFELDESLNNSYRGFFSSLEFIIVAFGYLLPIGFLAGLVLGARRVLRNFSDRE